MPLAPNILEEENKTVVFVLFLIMHFIQKLAHVLCPCKKLEAAGWNSRRRPYKPHGAQTKKICGQGGKGHSREGKAEGLLSQQISKHGLSIKHVVRLLIQ